MLCKICSVPRDSLFFESILTFSFISRPTALGKSIDEEKRKLRNLKLDSPSFETTGNEKDAFDCFSQTEEDRSSEKGNDFKKRTSVASSGYESCKTDSIYSDHRSSRTSG